MRMDDSGRIRIRPMVVVDSGGYSLIYRSAAWVRWDPVSRELFVPPEKGEDVESQVARIVRVLRTEYEHLLQLTPETDFTNVPPAIVAALKSVASDT